MNLKFCAFLLVVSSLSIVACTAMGIPAGPRGERGQLGPAGQSAGESPAGKKDERDLFGPRGEIGRARLRPAGLAGERGVRSLDVPAVQSLADSPRRAHDRPPHGVRGERSIIRPLGKREIGPAGQSAGGRRPGFAGQTSKISKDDQIRQRG